ncbi:MAG: CehA/McbA family metallohydrolase [Anaerolineae bacterium]|nr:CehA/McbA family metallohydrolase [Anaerolineae bacterium]
MLAKGVVFIKKIGVIGTLVAGCLLASLLVFFPAGPVLATQPTVTPTPAPVDTGDGMCRLELGRECDFRAQVDALEISTLTPKTNPPFGAQAVPTYTLVSMTFEREMKPDTINSETFYVQQGATRVAGRADYLAVSKVAVFYPNQPLQPETTYTATVTAKVQDVAGQPLAETTVWTFTTFAAPVRFGGEIDTAGVPVGGMTVYIGDLHTHSGYTDDAYLPGTPALAFATARANGLEFMALTGHDSHLNPARWQDILAQANAATVNGTFVGLRGFEYTNPTDGHLNVLETDTYVSWADPSYRNLLDFYAWLVARPNAIGEFNHPQAGFNFRDFAYYGEVDQKILLCEILSTNQTLLSLNRGWHVGILLNSDTHVGDWGQQKYMGLLATSLTKPAILEAIRARRTFYVSPYGQRMALVLQANGTWMGSALPNPGTINFTVWAYDPDHGGKPLNLALYNNGVRVATDRLTGATLVTWKPSLPAQLGHYYYAEAYHDGWIYPAYSSPIWIERRPVAKAGAAQPAPPGGLVTLDGRGSSDADGDTLVYDWVQQSGSPVSLNQNGTAQATFTAPLTLGNLGFRLMVTDTGSLGDDDTTVVTVTDRPILAITKSGPETAGPGELITYTLTVTNSGITTATGLLITDAIPAGTNYASGGMLMPGNVVSWTAPSLAANGEVITMSFGVTVTATYGIANTDYRVSCCGAEISATGKVTVYTNWRKYYLPVIMKAW